MPPHHIGLYALVEGKKQCNAFDEFLTHFEPGTGSTTVLLKLNCMKLVSTRNSQKGEKR
jgi:hypothetical protein